MESVKSLLKQLWDYGLWIFRNWFLSAYILKNRRKGRKEG